VVAALLEKTRRDKATDQDKAMEQVKEVLALKIDGLRNLLDSSIKEQGNRLDQRIVDQGDFYRQAQNDLSQRIEGLASEQREQYRDILSRLDDIRQQGQGSGS
jgi:hypothetical protein